MTWLLSRLREPSTYGGLAGLCIIGCFMTFTFWPHWRLFGYAAGVLFVIQALKSEEKGD
jgi:hypothetical protein